MSALSMSALLVAGACLVSGLGGMALKLAADKNSLPLFLASLCIYSGASFLLFRHYQLGTHGFVLTTFAALLGTLTITQILGGVLGEAVNWRALAVLVTAICAFAWAVAPGSKSSSPSNTEPSTQGVSHDDR